MSLFDINRFRVVDRPSPSFNERRGGGPIDTLVLHYTGMLSCEAALERLCDPEVEASAHYTVDEDGTIYAQVDEAQRAWHAGASHWRGATDVNSRAVGIEIVNPGHEWGYRPFPPPQMAAVIALCQGILSRHPIPPRNVVAHSDIAPSRKEDPGELFDWPRLARAGIGLWPQPGETPTDEGARLLAAALDAVDHGDATAQAAALGAYGYGVEDYGLEACLIAFRRRYRPWCILSR